MAFAFFIVPGEIGGPKTLIGMAISATMFPRCYQLNSFNHRWDFRCTLSSQCIHTHQVRPVIQFNHKWDFFRYCDFAQRFLLACSFSWTSSFLRYFFVVIVLIAYKWTRQVGIYDPVLFQCRLSKKGTMVIILWKICACVYVSA